MRASFVDLRKKSAQVIQALKRNERVTVLYRGKPAAVMYPVNAAGEMPVASAKDHPAVGMWADRDDLKDVGAYVRRVRRGRFNGV